MRLTLGFILFLVGLTDRLIGKQPPTYYFEEDDVGDIDDGGFDRLLKMNDKDFGFYVTGLFDSLNRDSIRRMKTEPMEDPDNFEAVVSDIYGDNFSEKMVGSLAGPAYLDDESDEYAVGVAHYLSDDSEEERVGLSNILDDYNEEEVGALFDVLMPHHRLTHAIEEYESALRSYHENFGLDSLEESAEEEIALGDIADFDSPDQFEELDDFDLEYSSHNSGIGDSSDIFEKFHSRDSFDSSEEGVGDIALGSLDFYDSSEDYGEVAVGVPMGPDMQEPGLESRPAASSEFAESRWPEQTGPSTEAMMVHEPEKEVSGPSSELQTGPSTEAMMVHPQENEVSGGPLSPSGFGESGISTGDAEPGIGAASLSVTGQTDNQLPVRGDAPAASASAETTSAPGAAAATTTTAAAATATAAASAAPAAAVKEQFTDTANTLVRALTDAVHDASKIAIVALQEEVKKTNDPVLAAGDVAKVEVEKGKDPVTAAVESAKAVVESPGSPAMAKATSEGKDLKEAVKEAEDAATNAAKVAIEAGATAEGAANAGAKEGVKAAEKPKDAADSTKAAETTSKAASTEQPKDTKEVVKEELKEELKKTADPKTAASDVAEKTADKGKDPKEAAAEAVKAVIETPGNPVMQKAKANGKTEAEVVKEATDEAEKNAKLAVDAGAPPAKAAKEAAKKAVEKAEEEPKSTTTTTEATTTTTTQAPTTTTTEAKDTKTLTKEELGKDLKKTADPVKAAGDVAKEVTKKGKDPKKAAKEAAKAVIETPGNPALKKAEEGGKSEAEAIKEVEEKAEKAAKIATDAGASPEKAAEAGAKAAIQDVEKPKEGGPATTSAASVQISTTQSAGSPSLSLDCECQEDWTFKGETYHHCDPRTPESEKAWCYVKGHCEDEALKPKESEIVKGENWIHCKPSDKPGSCDCQDSWSFKDTLYHHCDSRAPEAESAWCYVKDAEDCLTAKVSDLKDGQKYRQCIPTGNGALPPPKAGPATSPAPMATNAISQHDECTCKDSWKWEGNNYAGCDYRMPGAKRKWCYVKGHDKCKTAERSAEFPEESWIYCDKCDCEESWEYKGTTYQGCDALHPEGNRKWCYVWGRAECKSAEPSNALIGESWKYCDPCDCAKEWEFKGGNYQGCDQRMPEHNTHWCYVSDPATCTKYPKATVTPGQRWRECEFQSPAPNQPALPNTPNLQPQSTAAAGGASNPLLLEAKSKYAKASVQAPAEILSPPASSGGPSSPNMAAPQPAAAAIVFHPPQPQHSGDTMSEP